MALVLAAALAASVAPASAQEVGDLTLTIEGPSGELTTGSTFDARIVFDIGEEGIQGWSLGVSHDPEILELTSAENGATTLTANAGRAPDFLVLNTDPGGGAGFTQAVVISFTQPIFLPLEDGLEIALMSYAVIGDPVALAGGGECVPLETEVAFSDDLGNPPVSTLLTQNGESAEANLVNLPITVRCPGSIEVTRCEGDTENVHLEWVFGGPPTWDFLFLYRNGEFLQMLDIDATSYDDLGLEAGDYTYTIITFVVDDPANPTLLFAHCTATVIPLTVESIEPAVGDWLGGETVTVRGIAFTSAKTTTLEFIAPDEDPLPLEIIDVVSENEITARTPRAPRLGGYGIRVTNERGSAELADAFEYGFVRGEMNSEAPTDISDATYMLNFLFLGNQDPPLCPDSADVTDDGVLDISDPIVLLTFLFLGGDDPRPPFPEPGQDPTADGLGCLEPQP